MVKSKLPLRSGSSFEAVETHPQKGAIKFFFFLKKKSIMWGIGLNELVRWAMGLV